MKYAISACLMGECCKYSGGHNLNEELEEFMKSQDYITICPEVLGGLPIPRPCVELKKKDAITENGKYVTEAFVAGANIALQKIKDFHAELVITQSRSPSCGKGIIYDGLFHNKLVEGNGIFVEILIKNGIKVLDIEEFLIYKEELNRKR